MERSLNQFADHFVWDAQPTARESVAGGLRNINNVGKWKMEVSGGANGFCTCI